MQDAPEWDEAALTAPPWEHRTTAHYLMLTATHKPYLMPLSYQWRYQFDIPQTSGGCLVMSVCHLWSCHTRIRDRYGTSDCEQRCTSYLTDRTLYYQNTKADISNGRGHALGLVPSLACGCQLFLLTPVYPLVLPVIGSGRAFDQKLAPHSNGNVTRRRTIDAS